MIKYGEIPEYKLNYGFGETLKVGECAYRGSDNKPIPYIVKRLVFEAGYGVRIVTDSWSDCGLFIAASTAGWRKQRINYLNWRKEGLMNDVELLNKEINKLDDERNIHTNP